MIDIEFAKRFAKNLRAAYRTVRGNRRDQTILSEFLERIRPESKVHREAKLKIAKELEKEGKKVLVERALNFNGMRTRPDICFLENDKWNIIEVEFGNDGQNNIFRNYETISKMANVKVINIRIPNAKIEDVEKYLEVKKQIRGV